MGILFALFDGPKRPLFILKNMPGLSKKILYERLYSMQKDRILEREVIKVFPSHVEYRLSYDGKVLIPILKEIKELGLSADVLTDIIKCKWVRSILVLLSDKPLRTAQIKNALNGISNKVLSEKIKKLQRYGLIEKRILPSVPVTVEYKLSGSGMMISDYIRRYVKKGLIKME